MLEASFFVFENFLSVLETVFSALKKSIPGFSVWKKKNQRPHHYDFVRVGGSSFVIATGRDGFFENRIDIHDFWTLKTNYP
jgi:hypothetical protein